MSRIAGPVGVVACLALLLARVSGVHVHADAAGFIGAPETSFAHTHDGQHAHDGVHGLNTLAMPGDAAPHGAAGWIDDHSGQPFHRSAGSPNDHRGHPAHGAAGSPDDHHDHSMHGAAGSPDDHGDVRDVSLLETAIGAGKLPIAIVALALLFAVFALTKTLASADIAYPVLSGRHTRWRPPLRAPPQPV